MAQLILSIDSWGGMNARDQADQLVSRSHAPSQGGWAQYPGVGAESPDMLNVDYDPQGIQKRLGSASYADLSATIPSGDSMILGGEWRTSSGARIEFAVTTTTIMTTQSGSWAKINASTGATAFTFPSNVTKGTAATLEGHLFFFTDGASNRIEHTRDLAAMDANLQSGNLFNFAYGTATAAAVTGSWPQAVPYGTVVNSRLAWSSGNVLIEFTPMSRTSGSGTWDLAGSTAGNFRAAGNIRFLTTFIPRGGNKIVDEIVVAGTSVGLESSTGFNEYDRLNREEGSEAPLNHKCFCKSNNWLIYLTDKKNIHGYNGDQVIDLGERLKNSNRDGPLDNMHISTSETNSWAIYNGITQQAWLAFSTSTTRINDSIAVIDFKNGEPMPGEGKESFERRVRIVPWQIITPDSNDGFMFVYAKSGAYIGVKANGTMWTCNSGANDQGVLAISARIKSLMFTGGPAVATRQKQWARLNLRAIPTGNWDATINEYFDREEEASGQWTMTQVNSGTPLVDTAVVPFALQGGGVVRKFDRVDRRSEAMQWEIVQEGSSEGFTITNASLTYEVGAEVA